MTTITIRDENTGDEATIRIDRAVWFVAAYLNDTLGAEIVYQHAVSLEDQKECEA